jgi:protein-tyrosine phosphatase
MFWVTSYLGSSAADDFQEPGVVVVDVRDLKDGANPPEPVWQKIRTALEVVKLGNRVCIRCSAGISRSNSIAAAVLSLQEGLPYEIALSKVKKKIARAWPNANMIESVTRAIRQHDRAELGD